MLKFCLECLAGDRRDDAVYAPNIVSLNGRGAMPEDDNMIKLHVPKALNVNATILIYGAFKEERQTFKLYLTNGISEPDMLNVAFTSEIDFLTNTVWCGDSLDKSTYDGKTDFRIEMNFRGENKMTYNINRDAVPVRDNTLIPINNISFIVLYGDVSLVKKLEFEYVKMDFDNTE